MKQLIHRIIDSKIFQYIAIIVIAILTAASFEIFIYHNDFAPSGINGIATIVQYCFGFSAGYMSLLVNLPMLILAFLFLNRSFTLRSCVFVLFFSGTIVFLQHIDTSAIVFAAEDHGAKLLAAIAGGFFGGLFYSLAIRLGGSTGGTDIAAALINYKKPAFDMVWVIFAINAAVAALSFFVYDFSYEPVILCIVFSFVSSWTGDNILKGARSAARFEVYTTHAEELAEELMQKLRHGCTVIPATGMYSHTPRSILICIVNRRQVVDFEKIVKKYDDTFAAVSTVNGIVGIFNRNDE